MRYAKEKLTSWVWGAPCRCCVGVQLVYCYWNSDASDFIMQTFWGKWSCRITTNTNYDLLSFLLTWAKNEGAVTLMTEAWWCLKSTAMKGVGIGKGEKKIESNLTTNPIKADTISEFSSALSRRGHPDTQPIPGRKPLGATTCPVWGRRSRRAVPSPASSSCRLQNPTHKMVPTRKF